MKTFSRRFTNRKTYMQSFAKHTYKNLIFLAVFLCFMLLASVFAVVIVDNDDDNKMYDFSLPESNLKGLPHTMHYMLGVIYTTGG